MWRLMYKIKTILYRNGYRPKVGSIWFSPSLDTVYSIHDAFKKMSPRELLDSINELYTFKETK